MYEPSNRNGGSKCLETDEGTLWAFNLTPETYDSNFTTSVLIGYTYSDDEISNPELKVSISKKVLRKKDLTRIIFVENLTNDTWKVNYHGFNMEYLDKAKSTSILKPGEVVDMTRTKRPSKVIAVIFSFHRIPFEMLPLQNELGAATNSHHSISLLSTLCKDGMFSDVLVIGGDGYQRQAHINIMSASSEVFNAMFSHAMQEGSMHEVTIHELDKEGIDALIDYIYLGTTDNIPSDLFLIMLAMGEKYNLLYLKNAMEDKICETVTVDNAIILWRFAKLYNLSHLMEVVGSIFCSATFLNSNHYKCLCDPEILKYIVSLLKHKE